MCNPVKVQQVSAVSGHVQVASCNRRHVRWRASCVKCVRVMSRSCGSGVELVYVSSGHVVSGDAVIKPVRSCVIK
jgi:hypothetical protein